MGTVKMHAIEQSDILRLEAEMNNLWGELNTSNISNAKRQEIEQKITNCEEIFKSVLAGQSGLMDLEKNLQSCDLELAIATVNQAEAEIPKQAHTSSAFLALENIRRGLSEGKLKPVRARHEVKDIIRHSNR